MDLREGNCLELMKTLDDKSIDLLVCDLPYGETNCKWDIKIDMDEFWKEFKRVRKSKRTACIHFCSTKFGYQLIKSWEKGFKMDMVWKKRNKTGGLQSRHRPMRNHEMVYFFYDQAPKYNRDKYHKRIQAKEKLEKSETAIFGKVSVCKSNFEKSNCFEPPNPVSVMEEESKYTQEYLDNKQKCVGTGGSELQGIFTEKNRKAWIKANKGFTPTQPASVLEEAERKTIKNRTAMGESSGIYSKENQTSSSFEPPNPASVLEEIETDVWGMKKMRHGGLAGRKNKDGSYILGYEPPNPSSVLEEHDYAFSDAEYVKKKGNTQGTNNFEPPNPASVLEEQDERVNEKGHSAHGWNIKYMDAPRVAHFEPKLPLSIIEEEADIYGETKTEMKARGKGHYHAFEPPNPASVVEEEINDDQVYSKKGWKHGEGANNKEFRDKLKEKGLSGYYEPPNPASVVEENLVVGDNYYKDENGEHNGTFSNKAWKGQPQKWSHPDAKPFGAHYTPPNPLSVLEEEDELIEPAEDEPKSMFESAKVFIGKRNHQTEKPLDILEFFLKYWTDENDVVLDPTMGSGSTGVACKKLNRKFIGFELNPTIFQTAQKRIGSD